MNEYKFSSFASKDFLLMHNACQACMQCPQVSMDGDSSLWFDSQIWEFAIFCCGEVLMKDPTQFFVEIL